MKARIAKKSHKTNQQKNNPFPKSGEHEAISELKAKNAVVQALMMASKATISEGSMVRPSMAMLFEKDETDNTHPTALINIKGSNNMERAFEVLTLASSLAREKEGVKAVMFVAEALGDRVIKTQKKSVVIDDGKKDDVLFISGMDAEGKMLYSVYKINSNSSGRELGELIKPFKGKLLWEPAPKEGSPNSLIISFWVQYNVFRRDHLSTVDKK